MRSRLPILIALAGVLLATALLYRPGLDGPFIFDDVHNITANPMVPMDELSVSGLADAAYSAGDTIPKRGLSRVSFALDYHLGGNRFDGRRFKWTNVAIHLLNGVVVFLLARVLLRRRAVGEAGMPGGVDGASWVAVLAAALWLVHPLQLTSVLYVVQRMTSLSALFVFSGLLLYAAGRVRVEGGVRGGYALMAAGLCGGVALGMLNKENAALLPFLAWVVGRAFFDAQALPEAERRRLGWFHAVFVGVPLAAAVLGTVWTWPGIVAKYDNVRDFTMSERLLTQPRVVLLYVGLLVFPSLRRLSLHHDDFVVSSGLFSPPLTALALAVVLVAFALAAWRLGRGRLWAFAIVFFVVGHAMESTFIALEMVYEHRNYLPSFGFALLAADGLVRLCARVSRPALAAGVLSAAVLAGLGTVTWARAGIWGDEGRLARYMVEQHPDSARALSLLARVLAVENATAHDLLQVYARIAHADPNAIYPLIRMRRVVGGLQFQVEVGLITPASPAPDAALAERRWDPPKIYLDPRHLEQTAEALDAEIRRRLRAAPTTAETVAELEQVRRCIDSRSSMCVGLIDEADGWLRTALEHAPMGDWARSTMTGLRGQLAARRGKLDEALALIREAESIAPNRLYFQLQEALLLYRLGREDESRALLARLRAEHDTPGIERRGIIELTRRLEKMRAASGDAKAGADAGPGDAPPGAGAAR